MPRPEMAPELLDRFEREADLLLENPPPEIRMIYDTFGETDEVKVVFKEIIMAGAWLRVKLEERGCDKQKMEQILFAAGQRVVGADPWEQAERTLSLYDSGKPEMPGPELARKIVEEKAAKDKRSCCYKSYKK